MLSLCRTNVGSVPLSLASECTPQESQSTMVTPVRSVGGLDGSSCLVSSSLSSVLREESPLCHAYVCVVSPHLCVCMGMCMVWQRCAVGSALSVSLCPVSSANPRLRVGCASWRSQTWCVLACLPTTHVSGCLALVVCGACCACCVCGGVRTSHPHATPPSPHNPHYITSVLVGFPPTVAHTTRVLPRRVDLWNMVHVSLSFTRWVCGSVVHPSPTLSSVCSLLVGGRLTTLPPPSSTHSSITSCCDACVCPLVEGCWFGLARTTILSPHTRVAVAVTVVGWLCVCFTAHLPPPTSLPPPSTRAHSGIHLILMLVQFVLLY